MTTPSDHHPDRLRSRASDDVSREFWGSSAEWPTSEQPVVASARPHSAAAEGSHGIGATVRRLWNTTGPVPATRSHRTVDTAIDRPPTAVVDDDTDELDIDDWLSERFAERATERQSGGFDDLTAHEPARDPGGWSSDDWAREHDLDDWFVADDADGGRAGGAPVGAAARSDEPDDRWDTPVAPPRGGVDPLLARLGGLAVIVTLLVPVVLGFASSDSDDDALRTAAPAPTEGVDASTATAAASTSTAATTTAAAGDTAPASAAAATTQPAGGGTDTTDTVAASPAEPTTAAGTETVGATETGATGALTVDTCALEYEIAAGDFWIRIADAAGVALADVLAANEATVSTPLFPGSTICLPAGATTPAPPPTPSTSPATTAPAPTRAPAPTPTRPPAPTAPPTTAAPPPPPPPPASNASAAEVQAIIRAVWPDELEERALQVAWRESNFIPTAKNFCCYGVFQIYWSVHRGWLAEMGVTSAEQLYDPTVNARAALRLYQRSGGWGPWGG